MTHACHAHGCTVQVPPKLLMCRQHWFSVPGPVRDRVLREYRPGQEVDKRPTSSYLAVQRLAVALVAFKPNDEEAALIAANYMLAAVAFANQAIRDGEGDPLEGFTC